MAWQIGAAFLAGVLCALIAALAMVRKTVTGAKAGARGGLIARVSGLDRLFGEHHQREQHFLESLRAAGEETAAVLDRYCILADNLAASVVIRDTSGKVTYCSPYTEVLTGYAIADIYTATDDFFCGIVHEEDKANFQRALKVSLYGEAFQFRYRFYHKSGIEMWAETRTAPVLGPGGEVTLSLSITLDVTASVRYQRQVEERNRDLQDFSYMVTHDLKSPILTIKGMLSLLEEDHKAALTPPVQETLDHISRAVARLEQLVASVLQYSRLSSEEAQSEVVDLNLSLKEVLADFRAKIAEHEITVQCGNLPHVLGDKLKIYQIFGNLISNAIKYRACDRPCRLQILSERSKNPHLAIVTVADNGLGIPENKLDLLFRPFQRFHGQTAEGTGIGLASVKRLIEKLGGTIEATSREGLGTTFRLALRSAER